MYRVVLRQPGFAELSELVEIRSAAPKDVKLMLTVAPINTSVTITDSQTLVDPYQAG